MSNCSEQSIQESCIENTLQEVKFDLVWSIRLKFRVILFKFLNKTKKNKLRYLSPSKILLSLLLISFISCKDSNQVALKDKELDSEKVQENDNNKIKYLTKPDSVATPEGMVWIEGKEFMQGAVEGDQFAMPREKPAHPVAVNGFFMNITEVTNADFSEFVNATGYITVAERPIDWEKMKKELPAGTPKPADSLLQPGSLVFNKNVKAVVNMSNYNQWWKWQVGANWKHPYGPGSDIKGKANHPVVHVAHEDAIAYCKWAGRSLPTEAQWEAAARSGSEPTVYTWGNDDALLIKNANTWEGQFPINNSGADGFIYIAPVKSYPPNENGLYDMAGNVWEWTSDLYNEDYYRSFDLENATVDPQGPVVYKNSMNPYQEEMVMKGGSFLCHESYCSSYRISARMSTSRDSGSDHLGFRTVASVEQAMEK